MHKAFVLTYKGRAGSPFSTSLVRFLPKAGLELMLYAPLLMFAAFCSICSSKSASIKVGLPNTSGLSGCGSLGRFHMIFLPEKVKCVEKALRFEVEDYRVRQSSS